MKTLKNINLTGITGCLRCEAIGEACGMCHNRQIRKDALEEFNDILEQLQLLDFRFTWGFDPNFFTGGSSTDDLCDYDGENDMFKNVENYKEINLLLGKLWFIVEYFDITKEDFE